MSALPLTIQQIRAQVEVVLTKKFRPVVGLHSKSRWTGDPIVRGDGRTLTIRQCDSPLAIREALNEQSEEGAVTVIVTPLTTGDIGDDVRARLAKGRLLAIELSEVVRSLFQAKEIDPRILRERWLAEELLEYLSAGPYAAAPGAFLDEESAFRAILDRAIGLTDSAMDLRAVLAWSLDRSKVERFARARDEFRSGVIRWLSERGGEVVGTVLEGIIVRPHIDSVSIGLAASVLYHEELSGRIDKAVGKFEERYLAGRAISPAVLRQWGAASTALVRGDLAGLRAQLQDRGDQILREVGGEPGAYVSDTSPMGFTQRCARYGAVLSQALTSSSLETVMTALDEVARHDRAKVETAWLDRARMAARLVRWIRTASAGDVQSLKDAGERYLRETSFVDWARLQLRHGDLTVELASAYKELTERILAQTEPWARGFGMLLADKDTSLAPFIPVERLIDEVVVPLATHAPILLLVMDGMSVAVARELLTSITSDRGGWVLQRASGSTEPLQLGVATIPSITDFSRTSLFSGKLIVGQSANEKINFSQHTGLKSVTKSTMPPVLFHKGDLSDDVKFAAVRKELSNPLRKVVGVVVNAIDDSLLKGDQVAREWDLDALPMLGRILEAARDGGRTVVLTSDHGHVLEVGSEFIQAEDAGDRFRPITSATKTVADDRELELSGPRVCDGTKFGVAGVLVPWAENVRYSSKKVGYHGGVSPQEMLTPIAIIRAASARLEGYEDAVLDFPSWWELERPLITGVSSTIDLPREAAPGETRERALTHVPIEPQPVSLDDTLVRSTRSGWIERFLSSEVYEVQKKVLGRTPLPDERLVEVLERLSERGGTLTGTAFSRALNIPAVRVSGFIAQLQRVLNVEGYSILSYDGISDTVSFNVELLKMQFGITE